MIFTHPSGKRSISCSTVRSTYSNTRCKRLFFLNTSIKFTRLGCFNCWKEKRKVCQWHKTCFQNHSSKSTPLCVYKVLNAVHLYCSHLTLPMLRLLSAKVKGWKDFWKSCKPCQNNNNNNNNNIVIWYCALSICSYSLDSSHWVLSAEYPCARVSAIL